LVDAADIVTYIKEVPGSKLGWNIDFNFWWGFLEFTWANP